MVTTSCVLYAPRCLHHSPAGTFARVPGRCLRWSPTHRGPRWSPAYRYIYIYIKVIEVLHLYRCVTHTHPAFGRVVPRKMRWRWGWRGEWRWDDHEDEMKNYLTRTRRGERKRRRREHQHDTPGPERGKPERAREKKAEGRRTRNKTSGGGEDEAPEPTWHSENLHTPQHATEPTYLGREERMR